MRAQLGTPVRSRDDKPLGHVEWVLVEPESRVVKSIGVRHGLIRDYVVKIPLDEIRVGPSLDHLIANIDEVRAERLPQPGRRDESEARAGEAVSASTPGAVWPADTFINRRPQPATVPMHTEYQEMSHMLDADVVVLGDGSDVYAKDMHHAGGVDQIRFETHSGQILSIIVRAGVFHHREFELPGELIGGVDEGAIYLNVDRDAVKQHILGF